jgi:dihydrofolate synthase/folylpolyglutamate synthase
MMAFLLCQVVLEKRDLSGGLPKVNFLREAVRKKKFEPLKGRFEKWRLEGRKITFVGAHNIDGVRKLTHSIKESSFDEVILSFSKRSKKDILDGLLHLDSYPCVYKKIILTSFDHEKAWMMVEGDRDEVERSERISFVDDWKEYWHHHLKGTNILVTGSYYFIGEVQKYLLSRY